MNKKSPLFLVIIVFLLRFNFVFADVSINEISYDLDGGDIDFVEVVNSGSDVDLTSLKLFIDNSTSNHSINNSSGASVLHNGEYGVIVQSGEITSYTERFGTAGNIFTSSFSLPNDAGQVQINNGDKNSPISSVSYSTSQGASGDGNSLQKINGSWVIATPTPGQINTSSSNNNSNSSSETTNTNTTSSDNSTGTTSTTSEKQKVIELKIKTYISAENNGFVGIPITFSGNTTGHKNEALLYGKYYWNFGDGDSKEIYLNQEQKFTHTYYYPGEYNVNLEFYDNYYAENPEAVDSMVIKIVPADVTISSVGDSKDFFVELYNSSSYDVDISKWSLQSDAKSFVFSKNTILQSKSKMKVSSHITNFTTLDSNSLRLVSSTSEVVYDYVTSKFSKTRAVSYKPINTVNKTENVKDLNVNETINPEDLTSSAINTNFSNNYKNSIFIVSIFIILLIISISIVYFLRKRVHSDKNKEVSDFEILAE
ncbi:MAG: lamin tail domain-containing protein [Patescibacteria group bacterium]